MSNSMNDRRSGCRKASKPICLSALAAMGLLFSLAHAQQPARDASAARTLISPTTRITPRTYESTGRQWATEAFFVRPHSGLKSSPKRYGQIVSFASNLQFSFVNPNNNPISVSLACFDAAGTGVQVAVLSGLESGSYGAPEIRVAGNGAFLRRATLYTPGEAWCRASSSEPFLFFASILNHERLANPDEAQDKVKVWQTAISTVVLVK